MISIRFFGGRESAAEWEGASAAVAVAESLTDGS